MGVEPSSAQLGRLATQPVCLNAKLVGPEGIEPSSPGSKPGVLSVERQAQMWRKHKESNSHRLLTSGDGFQDRLPTLSACFQNPLIHPLPKALAKERGQWAGQRVLVTCLTRRSTANPHPASGQGRRTLIVDASTSRHVQGFHLLPLRFNACESKAEIASALKRGL